MKKYLLYLLTALLFSCTKNYVPRNIDNIQITSLKRENTSIRAIHAINQSSLVYVGSKGDFVKTTDNGKTWQTITISYKDSIKPEFRSLAFNGKSFFALSVANPGLLYKITNDEYTLVYKEEGEKVFYDAIQFYEDLQHGIAVGDPTEDCASILITKDAGETWTKILCDNLPKFEEGEAFFAASNTNIKTIGNTVWIASGGKKARILKSTDFGKSWEIFQTPIIQGDGPQGIYSIDFYSKDNGIVFGGNYAKPNENTANKAITKDGGKSWQLVANNKNPSYKSCVQYVPNTNGLEIFAVGKTGVSFSNDGGKTWKQVSEDSYYSIQFVDKNTAWLSGNEKIGKLEIK